MRRKKTYLCCICGSLLPLVLCCRSFLVSGMRQRFCCHGHGSPGDVASTELPVVLSAWTLIVQQLLGAPRGMLGEQMYSLGSQQTFRPRDTDDSISKRQSWDPGYSETHYCFSFPFCNSAVWEACLSSWSQ